MPPVHRRTPEQVRERLKRQQLREDVGGNIAALVEAEVVAHLGQLNAAQITDAVDSVVKDFAVPLLRDELRRQVETVERRLRHVERLVGVPASGTYSDNLNARLTALENRLSAPLARDHTHTAPHPHGPYTHTHAHDHLGGH